jgi:hypothetical protein
MDVCVPASEQHSPKKNMGGGSRISIPIELYCNDQYESGCNTIGRNLANEYVRC